MEAVKDDEIAETMSEADSVDSTSTSPPQEGKGSDGAGCNSQHADGRRSGTARQGMPLH